MALQLCSLFFSFYVNATHPKFAPHYNMYTHVTLELPQVIEAAGIPIVSPHFVILAHTISDLDVTVGLETTEYLRA